MYWIESRVVPALEEGFLVFLNLQSLNLKLRSKLFNQNSSQIYHLFYKRVFRPEKLLKPIAIIVSGGNIGRIHNVTITTITNNITVEIFTRIRIGDSLWTDIVICAFVDIDTNDDTGYIAAVVEIGIPGSIDGLVWSTYNCFRKKKKYTNK